LATIVYKASDAYYCAKSVGLLAISMVSVRFALVPIQDLKTHEAVEPDRVRRVVRQLQSTGMVKKAIAVDSESMVVLDGVHRLSALKELGCVKVPAWLIDYSDDDVLVFSKDKKSKIKKEAVVRAAVFGPKFPPKTTRHMVKRKDGALVHISHLEGEVSVPLSTLFQG
jgi:L-serine kinase (ADP)